MDYLAADGCYRTKVRIFQDDPRTYTLRWFVVPDCTPIFPGHHLFAAFPWKQIDHNWYNMPGEVEGAKRVWDRGLPPPQPNPFRGDLEWYRTGVPISALTGR